MTTTTTRNVALPGAIETTLRRLIWRARAAIVLRGVLATLVAGLVAILAAMGIGAKWLIVDAWQHYALTGLWVLAAAATAFWTLLRPLARSFTLTGIARVLEQRHPELQERISSTVELLSSPDAPEVRGSEALINALALEAIRDALTVQPRREITFRKARPALVTLGACLAVLGVLLAVHPNAVGPLLAKTVAPYLNLPNLRAGELDVTPKGKVIAQGDRLKVSVAVLNENIRARLSSAELRLLGPDGADEVFKMMPDPDAGFSYTTAPLSRSARYRVRAGDAITEYYNVTVVPRPAVRHIEIGYDYPQYTGLPNLPPTGCAGDILAPAETVATVRVTLNKPVRSAMLFINNSSVEVTPAGDDGQTCSFQHHLKKGAGGSWRLELTDLVEGISGASVEHSITVTPDAPPTARILRPEAATLKLKPRDRLPVIYAAGDDYGLSRAELLVAIDGKSQPAQALQPAAGPGAAPAASTAYLDLADLDLASARRVTCQVRVLDNLPKEFGGPQEGLSEPRTINLDVKAPAYTYQVQVAMDVQIREALERILKQLQAARKISEPLRQSMPATARLSPELLAQLDTLRKHAASAEEDARLLARQTAGGSYPLLTEKLNKLADNHIGKARELVELIKMTDDQKKRGEDASEADFQIGRALDIVTELLKEFDVLTDLARDALALEELAERQKELAAAKAEALLAAEAATQPAGEAAQTGRDISGQMSDKQWQQAQRELAREAGELVRQKPDALKEALADRGKQTANLAQQAEALQKEQLALMRDTTAARDAEALKTQLAAVAKEQQRLAGQVGQLAQQQSAVKPVAEAARQASAAAQTLSTTQPAGALTQQADAAKALDDAAKQAAAEAKDRAAQQLADLAEQMAQRQDELAKTSQQTEEARLAAEKAQQAAAQAAARQQQAEQAVTGQAPTLAARQAELAKQARQIESAGKPSKDAQPAAAMEQSAAALQRNQPEAAQPQADRAATQAGQLARETAAASEAEGKAAAQAGQKAADAANAARAADASAKAAAQKAAAAEAKAAASGAEADKQAAAAARAEADKTAGQSAAAQAAAEAARKPAQAARDAADQAAKNAAAAGRLSADQAGLAKEIAQAAAQQASAKQAARQAAEQQAAAKQGQAQVARQDASTAAAQAQLQRQVPQLQQLAQQANPQAQQAVAKNDPTPNMQRAAAALQAHQPGQAAAAQKQAAQQLRQIAQAARPQQPQPKDAQPARAIQVARSAEDYAKTQRQLAARTAELLGQLAKAQAQQEQTEQTRLQAQQKQIEREAAVLADDVRQHAPQPDRIDTKAAQAAAETSQALARGQLPEAARAGQDAARKLGEISRRLGKPQPESGQGEPGKGEPGKGEPGQGQPGQGQPGQGQPGQGQPGQGQPGQGQPGQGQPGQGQPGQGQPGQGQPGQGQPGQGQPGQGSPSRSGQVQAAAPPSSAQEPEQVAAGQAPTDVERRAEIAQRAGDLAGRQQRVAEDIASLAAHQTAALLASRQQQIQQATEQTRQGAELVQEHIADLVPGREGQAAQQQVQAASRALQQASQAQQAAAQAAQAGQPGRALPNQANSAAALARAAQALNQLGQQLAQQAGQVPATARPDIPPEPGQLADAQDAAQSAAQSQALSDAARAARMLAALAWRVASEAAARGVRPGQEMSLGTPQGNTLNSDNARAGISVPDPSEVELKRLGISAAEWMRLPGELRDEVLQAGALEGPEEYRALVKRYFQALARKGAAAGNDENRGK